MVCCSVVCMPTRNFGPGTSFPGNFGPGTIFPWNFGPIGPIFHGILVPGPVFHGILVPGPIFHGILVLGTNFPWTIGPEPKIHGGTKNPFFPWNFSPGDQFSMEFWARGPIFGGDQFSIDRTSVCGVIITYPSNKRKPLETTGLNALPKCSL